MLNKSVGVDGKTNDNEIYVKKLPLPKYNIYLSK
jgi:hypothetical protein